MHKNYGHVYDAFMLVLAEEVGVVDPFDVLDVFDIPDEIKNLLKQNIKRKLAPKPTKIHADIEDSCFTYEGIDSFREVLYASIACGEENSANKVKLITPPIYTMNTIKELITKKRGKLDVKLTPKAASDKDETELQDMMEHLAMVKIEVGDDENNGKLNNNDVLAASLLLLY